MAWNFRKRVKIAPGVYLNFSKKGVSTTVGRRGASVSFGKNGTYLNTGIPGTGLYNRQKIGGSVMSKTNTSGGNANNEGGANNKACLRVGCCFATILFVVGTLFLIINSSFDSETRTIAATLAFFAVILYLVIFKKEHKKANSQNSRIDEESNHSETVETPQQDNTSFGKRITEENYLLIEECVNKLYKFLSSKVKQQSVRDSVDDVMKITDSKTKEDLDIDLKITYTMLADIHRIYKGLGHDIYGDDEELIGLYLFVSKVADSEMNVNYSQISFFKKRMSGTIGDTMKITDPFVSIPSIPLYEFFFEKIFNNVDEKLSSQYSTLMYRFASAVAKADGKVSESETEYLSKIKSNSAKKQDSNVKVSENSNTSGKTSSEELEDLIGLTSVKEEVLKLTNLIKVQQMREKKGLNNTSISYHTVFTGNPGTGKTTVARIIAGIYKDLGILKKGHLVETDRSGLVAEYVGQTAVKTNKIIDSALDGVLFIDEAYSLVTGSQNDYGTEAISTLLKRMEDDRNRLVVILAGYGSEMKQFIDSNPGLQSRFNRYINFPDYSAEELYEIFIKSIQKNDYTMTDSALNKLQEMLKQAVANKDKNFGNARFVRNIFEKTLENQATRVAAIPNITAEILSEIREEDIV